MTATLPSAYPAPKPFLLLFIAAFLWLPSGAVAQVGDCNCTNCPQFMQDLFVGDFNLTVQNASNPTLGQNGQGVCGVVVHWDHTAICDISITLTSPSGQSVTLVGPIGQFCTNMGNVGTDWNVTFLPCNDPNVAPDPGFSAQWNNNQPWGANNAYTGSYYPFAGCLENFSGPVNGDWTLTVNDGQPNDVGNLYDYEIIFCDPSGINCFTCLAGAGDLPQADVIACQGEPALNLSLPPAYAPPAMAPPPTEYSYTYIVAGTGGVILAYEPGPDLTGYAPGNYTVCGLSYYTGNLSLLPNPNGTLTITQLRNQLDSNTPPFCGEISDDCVGVTIKALPPNVEETGEVCAPDCYVYYGQGFCQTGTHTVALEQDGCPYTGTLYLTVHQPVTVLVNEVICPGGCSQNPSFPGACAAGSYQANLTTTEGCDSIVFLNLSVVNILANIQQPVPTLDCNQNSVILQGFGSTTGPGTTYLWSASNGGNILGPNTNLNATVDAPGDYQLRVCRSQGGVFCCDSVSVTVTANQNLPNTPVVSGNDTLCQGQTDSFWVALVPGADSYTWTLPPGVSIDTGQGTDSILVTWNSTSGGDVCVVANNDCGQSTPACFTVMIASAPAAAPPVGDTLVCAGDTVLYTLSPVPGANTYNWQINGGSLLSGNGTDSVWVVWDANLPSGAMCAVAAGDCGASPSACLNIVVNAPPAQPVLSGDSTLCAGVSGTYTLQAVPGATAYLWTVSGGSILSGQNSTALTVDWPTPPGGTVCANAQGACGAGPQQCFPVSVLAQPVANAGPDRDTCGTVTLLSATASVAGSTGLWTLLPGAPGTVMLSPPDAAQSTATASTSGTYFFQWTETNSICTDVDTVQVDFNAAPQIGQIQSDCDGANQNYTISFPVSGGVPPYSIAGGVIVGGVFTSNPIPSGQNYSFVVTDANGCSSMSVSGNVNCNCTSDAGQMSLTTLTACPGVSVTAQQQGGVLDGNDVGAYVLHTGAGAALGTILDQNTTGTFGFLAGMSYGVTYYISYVVGNDLNGFPDPADPCLSVAQGQPVIFYDNPVTDAGADVSGCGLTLPISGSTGATSVQWSVTAAPPGGTATIANPQSPAGNVTATIYGAYTLTYTVTQNGCVGSDDVVLTFQDAPVAGAVSRDCDGANLNYTVSFPISGGAAPYSVNGVAVAGANFQSLPLPTGSTYSFIITDANGCVSAPVSGQFNCNCATNAGTMATAPVRFCAGQPASAVWNNDATLDTDDMLQYILHSDPGASLGTVYATGNQPQFDFVAPLQTGVTYYISAIAGNNAGGAVDLTDPCLDIAVGTPVQWKALPTAALTGDTSFCAGGSALLRFIGTGTYPLQVQWTTGAGAPMTVDLPGPQAVALPVSPSMTTTYTLLSVTDGTQPVCTTALSGAATVTIFPIPVADAGPDKLIGCGQSGVTLGGTGSSTGAGIIYTWTLLGNPVGNALQLSATEAGVYTLLVTNSGGCTASDMATVVIDNTAPVANTVRVRQIPCFGDDNGSIVLDSIVSAHPPVLFSLNGGPFGPLSQFAPLEPGKYVVTLQDASGCEWRTDTLVIVAPVELLVDLGTELEIALGEVAYLNALASVPVTALQQVAWNPLLDTLAAGTLSQQFTPLASRIVRLTITDLNGCTASDEVRIVVTRPKDLYIPNVIKPGAGGNERLVVFAGPSVAGVDYLRLYDRWGELVFEDLDFQPNDYAHGWDGQVKGKNADPGVYAYYAMIRYVDGRTEMVRGDVTVLR